MPVTKIKSETTKNGSKDKTLKTVKVKSEVNKKVIKPEKQNTSFLDILFGIGRYFKNAWAELRQVRWPDRKAAWKLTVAVIIFTGFFVALIILLDYLFQLLFKVILK